MTLPLITLIIIWAVMVAEGIGLIIMCVKWRRHVGNKGVDIDCIVLTISKLQRQVEELRG